MPRFRIPWPQPRRHAHLSDDARLGIRNLLLREQFTLRRGGTIGIGDKGAVAFRFDHGLNKFGTHVVPLLAKYEIPATQAYFTDMFGESARPAADDQRSWADAREWAAKHGIEPTSHSHTHGMVHTPEAVEQQIRGSASILAREIPGSIIETYTVPGGGSHYFPGGKRPSDFYDSPAGRLILETYAVSTGFMGGNIRQLDGQVRQGLRHTTIDQATSMRAARSLLDRAATTRSGAVLMLHPSRLNHGRDHTTVADLEALIAHAAALRDAGQLEIMTLSGITLAETGSSRRLNLIAGGDFPSDWERRFKGSNGWSHRDGLVETSTAGDLSQSIAPGWARPHRGIVMQISARVRSDSSGLVRIGSTTTGSETEASVGSGWRTIRAFATMPADSTASFEVHVSRASGQVQVADFRLEPI